MQALRLLFAFLCPVLFVSTIVQAQAPCFDIGTDCAEWQAKGACNDGPLPGWGNRETMRDRCTKTCGYCK
ncbi:hypothetical protein AAVH_40460 [Aphelenchoides avenae]|nr:hypothetical protein AAVH_40460 [Aphelenchus avenae]